ncbi:MAG: ABC transporter permease subunit [Pirellulaceae bacterium]|nr:ABC transporter permease subunit [Pirellulaceae bacterium]
MPVHDLGYRSWAGKRMSHFLRPWVVARGGIALVWRRRWLRMMIIFSALPILIFGFAIFMFEYAATDADARHGISQLLAFQFRRPDLALAIATDHSSVRHDVWATLILTFFRVPQLFAMVLLVGLIAPMLISYDLRSKAYLLYFSRPLSPSEYILGKSAVIWFFLCTITAIPALALYLVGVFLSPDLSVLRETWDLPLRILAATAVLVIPTTALALCYSSFTSESRYATFSWFATWGMGFVAYNFLTYAGARVRGGPPGRRPRRGRRERWEEAQSNVLNTDTADQAVMAQGQFNPDPIGAGQFGPDQFGPDQIGPDQIGPDQFGQGQFGPGQFGPGGFRPGPPELENVDLDRWRLLSPYETLGKVQSWVFGLDPTDGSVWPSVAMLVAITVIGFAIVRYRIVARLSV